MGTEYLIGGYRGIFSGRGHDGESSLHSDKGGEKGRDEDEKKEGGGGSSVSGPRHYSYDIHNILYRVAEDNSGAFNGSDDFAMKAAGNDRLGSLEFAKQHISRLQVPLTATIDYFGFRVLAVAKIPTERVLFSSEGEVRRVTEDLMHGLQANGDFFVNKSKDLLNLLEAAGRQMNLVKHDCRGIKDKNTNSRVDPTYISAETLIYKDGGVGSEDAFGSGTEKGRDEYYMKDFWRSFPPEIPDETPHLIQAPREQSVFWRLLRPEFVRNYPLPLNPDAGCLASEGAKDHNQHYEDLCRATRSIREDLVPHLVEVLIQRDFALNPLPLSEGFGLDLAKVKYIFICLSETYQFYSIITLF